MELAFLNIGSQEMFLIVIVVLLLFGGKKLPELARGLGRGIREFKDASEGIKREISDQINSFEKDIDVTSEEHIPEKKQSVSNTTEVKEEPTQQPADQSPVEHVQPLEETEKKKYQFTAPENTYQHDPGAHPLDRAEQYRYGNNSDDKTTEQGAVSSDKPNDVDQSKQA